MPSGFSAHEDPPSRYINQGEYTDTVDRRKQNNVVARNRCHLHGQVGFTGATMAQLRLLFSV
jgi:hypothetical protein